MIKSKAEILEKFINNIPQFVFWKDRDSIYQGCNLNFANYAGYNNPDQIMGRTDYHMPWTKEEADFFIKTDQDVMKSGISQLNFEEPQTLANGSKRWLSTSKVPLFNNEKQVVGILGWYIDITPYKTMQLEIDEKNKALLQYSQQLEKSKDALEKVNRDLEMFTYAVSHDLKSPIRTIVGFTELIRKSHKNNLNQKTLEKIDIILNSGRNMNNLVENILTFARTGLEDLNVENIEIKKFITDKISDLDQLTLNKNSEVILDFPKSEISCYSDLLGIVFYNVIGNGLKYNESENPVVKCTLIDSDTEIIFSIADNGIGIDSKFKETIFQPFKRLNSSRIEGSGLGLSICKRIIELHKGKIWIENDSSKGTNVKFTISKFLE